MESEAQSSAVSAVSDVLGGHGLARSRKPSIPAKQAARIPTPTAPIFHYSAAAMGPAPFISPRQQQPPHQVPIVSAGRSGIRLHSPPRHTAVTIDATSPPVSSFSSASASGAAVPLRFPASPLSVDTSPGPYRHPPSATSHSSFAPTGRRRTPSGAAATAHASGPGSPQRKGRLPSPSAPPPLNGTVLSSSFVRRKPQQRPPSPTSNKRNFPPASDAPPVYFFQDADSDTASQLPRDCHRDGDSNSDLTDSSHGSTADDSTDRDVLADSVLKQNHKAETPASSPNRQRTRSRKNTSHHHNSPRHQALGIEKLGELSRDEEAFDFAIVFKPSKVEEHLEIIQANGEPALARVGSHAQSLATSANGIDDTTAPSVAAPAKAPDTPRAQLRRHKYDPAHARAQLVQRITQTGLQVKRLRSLDGRQTLLKVKAPQSLLELGAERLRLRKPRKFDQIWMEFACELRETFRDFDATRDGVQFLDSEKQSIVHALLTSDASAGGAGLNEFCPLTAKHVLKMFPLHKHDDLVTLRRHWVTYWRGEATGLQTVKRLGTHALHQPVDAIAQYYGERIAFYFAWIEMYTQWLVVPSIAGVLLFILQVRAKTLDHPLASVYAIGMALWTSAFLLAWKRRAAALAYKWGTLGYEEAEQTRPAFYGDPAYSTATTKVYPAWKRYVTYAATVPLVLASIALVLVLTFYAFVTRDRHEARSIAVKTQATHVAKDIARDLEHGLTLANLKRLTALGMDWDFWFYFLITPILYGLLIPVLDYAFTKLARRMTHWENHQTESHYQSHLILKVFSFRFVHVFASLYYYAFNSAATAKGGSGGSLLRLAVQLASFMVSDQLWRNVMQTLYPFVMRRVQMQRKKAATNAQFHASTVFNSINLSPRGGRGIHPPHPLTSNALIHEQCVRLEQASDHAWEEAELEPYDTFEDYTEMLIQFGYVTFFSLAFPLAPLLALVNNVVEIRMDAFKLCHAKQRPLAQKASGIGVWSYVLQLMSVLAVLTNCLHIAFTTTLLERLFPQVSATHKVWIVFGLEHAILALKVWMMVIVPSTPSAVKTQVRKEREHAKMESARAMAAKIQSQQLQLQLQLEQQLELQQQLAVEQKETEKEDTLDHSSSGVRRRCSRGPSGSMSISDGLRAAQAVLEDA